MKFGNFRNYMQNSNKLTCVLGQNRAKQKLVLATHGLLKKDKKTPADEIARAERI